MDWEGTVWGLSIEDWRNIALIALGVFGLPLAIWRNLAAHNQTKINARSEHLDRFHKGVAMMSEEGSMTRIAGLVVLQGLVVVDRREFETPVVQIVVEFLYKYTSHDQKGAQEKVLQSKGRPEVQAIIDFLFRSGVTPSNAYGRRSFDCKLSIRGVSFLEYNFLTATLEM